MAQITQFFHIIPASTQVVVLILLSLVSLWRLKIVGVPALLLEFGEQSLVVLEGGAVAIEAQSIAGDASLDTE